MQRSAPALSRFLDAGHVAEGLAATWLYFGAKGSRRHTRRIHEIDAQLDALSGVVPPPPR